MAKKTAAPTAESTFGNAKLYTWVKALEGKINNLNREFNMVKNDLIKRSAKDKKELKNFDSELVELRHQVESMNNKLDLIIKELKQTAGIEEVEVIKKYIEFWNPMNFVTHKDLDRLFEFKKDELLKAAKGKDTKNSVKSGNKKEKVEDKEDKKKEKHSPIV
jgi:hypothetical protein